MINQHPIAGWHILREFKVSDEGVLQITRSHHERIDGGGYSDRLAGNEIPMLVRVVAVADVFDALRAARPYKPPLEPLDVIDEMYADEGHFDLLVLNALARVWQQVGQEVCEGSL